MGDAFAIVQPIHGTPRPAPTLATDLQFQFCRGTATGIPLLRYVKDHCQNYRNCVKQPARNGSRANSPKFNTIIEILFLTFNPARLKNLFYQGIYVVSFQLSSVLRSNS